MRVVVDTNVFISRSISNRGNPARVFEKWEEQAFELLVSDEILAEYRKALGYERIRKRHGYTPDQMDELVEKLSTSATLVVVSESPHIVADDPDDDKFIGCAVAGGADYIVSGDAHLLALAQYRGIQILSPATFLLLLGWER
jgi:putative PIN family toxin of toxin-antitoxin system